MEKLINCPVCSNSEITEYLSCQDYVSSNETFTIYRCNNCTLQFTNPRPKDIEIGKYYQSDKYISHSGSEKKNLGLMYKIYDMVRNFSITGKLNIIKTYHKSGKLLDLGCGMGYFANGVKQDKTFDLDSADVSEEAMQYVKKTFNIDVMNENNLNNIPANSYDTITQWHVIEHVHKIEERMLLLKKILKQDGTMFIAVPNQDAWDAKYYKNCWDGYDVPRHILHFNRNSFSHLMERYGFKIVAEKPLWFDAPYISMRSEIHKGNNLSMLRGGIVGIISNVSAIFTRNYSSIMFIVKHHEK